MLMLLLVICKMVCSHKIKITRLDAEGLTYFTEMPPTGRYYILVFTSNDLLDQSGTSQSALQSSVDILQKFPKGTVTPIVMHPLTSRFEWTDLPAGVKTFAEMRTYGVSKKEDVYQVLGVSKDDGVVAVVRPDGYVGMMAPLSKTRDVEDYLRGCLVTI